MSALSLIHILSNGVNGYIKKVEEDTLSSYPLTISKQDYDLSSMMGGQGATDDEASNGEDSSDDGTDGKAQGTDKKMCIRDRVNTMSLCAKRLRVRLRILAASSSR